MASELLSQPELEPSDPSERPTVLVIEDDHAMRDVLCRRLRHQGFNTRDADCGQTGLDVARRSKPALILLDLRLPDIDGFSVCRQLVDSPETCNIPVVILSGMERPDIIRRSREAGCSYFIRKPYDPNALLVLIRQAIDDQCFWDPPED